MNIGYDIALALPELRAQAESRMTETVVVGLYTDTTDPVTLNPVRTLTTERYSGPGRIRYVSSVVGEPTGPGGPISEQAPVLSVPAGSAEIHDGDEVEVSASSADSLIVGRRYQVTGVAAAGQVTANRYRLKELS